LVWLLAEDQEAVRSLDQHESILGEPFHQFFFGPIKIYNFSKNVGGVGRLFKGNGGLLGVEFESVEVIKVKALEVVAEDDGELRIVGADIEEGNGLGEVEGRPKGNRFDFGGEARAGGPGAEEKVNEGTLRDVEAVAGGGMGQALEVLAELFAFESFDEADEAT
jgi:hypothetical protein